MPISGNSSASQMWTQIVSILNSEKTTGRLPTVKDVRKSIQLWTGKTPSIGVQLVHVDEGDLTTKTHKITATFNIAVATQSVDGAPSGGQITPANLDDAMAQLQTVLGDGGTNGLDAILRDPTNFSLSGAAPGTLRTKISSVTYDWDIRPGQPPQIWAYGLLKFQVEALVKVT